MLRDITLILLFLIIGLSIYQLRFNRNQTLRTVTWILCLLVSVAYIVRLSEDLSKETRLFFDILFWVGEIGLVTTYFLQKRHS